MKVIAHRGASAYAPENTLAAFRRAVKMGAKFIETDLQLTRDAHLVALHDETLDRTTNGRGRVSDLTLAELKKLDAGARFVGKDTGKNDAGRNRAGKGMRHEGAGQTTSTGIPTIEEILAFGREHDVGLYLEMKMPGGRGAERILVGALRAAGYLHRAVVISFDSSVLVRTREIEPAVVTGYLLNGRSRDGVAEATDAGAGQLLPRASRITRKVVEAAHRSDLEVIAWTVNTARRMKQLLAMGVDGMITNYPDRLAAVLQRDDEGPMRGERTGY